uniref:WAP domain-containing protein n=1 Tax=Trichuris muris TaxID=70415 RepID=A0A5S6QJS3_TRIMR
MNIPLQVITTLTMCLLQLTQASKPGSCPTPPFPAGFAQFCRNDDDCDGPKKCCLTEVGYECTGPKNLPTTIAKPGKCPPASSYTGKVLLCANDGDCEGSQKCCMTKAGNACVPPVDQQDSSWHGSGTRLLNRKKTHCKSTRKYNVPLTRQNFVAFGDSCSVVSELHKWAPSAEKPGSCPTVRFAMGSAEFCRTDAHCSGAKKCCVTNVGYECTDPVKRPLVVDKPGSCPPAPSMAGMGQFCQTDVDCQESKKCCLTSIGYDCTEPANQPTGTGRFCRTDSDCHGRKKCCLTKVGYDCVSAGNFHDTGRPGKRSAGSDESVSRYEDKLLKG